MGLFRYNRRSSSSDETISIELQAPYMQENQSFKIEVETFCKHFTQKENYLPVKGKVKLKNPEIIFQYIEYYGTDPKSPPENPYMVFFGCWITNGLRQLIQNLSLKTRKFIGNTSMDPQLSLLMANQAQVQSSDIILDPFVGSGSLLVAAAQFGGYVLGTDIDYLMLHARTRPSRITQKERDKDESVKANMAQYNLDHKYLDVLVNDFAIQFWKDDLRFDAIITDPPYGIRSYGENRNF
ncbi:rna methylase-related [Holotrichia oblita]|uniref:Rna methylase-related n=1 Tax=Holotrichia oblita TaxID=644536 RepID=A0ACB9SQE4_HOLOL|nr:rna methylase-related [Holotrichia oblita]